MSSLSCTWVSDLPPSFFTHRARVISCPVPLHFDSELNYDTYVALDGPVDANLRL